MKNAKAIAFLVLALLAGLAAATYAAMWVSRQANIASNKVVVAAMDIELGSKINPQMLTAVDWPSGSVPPGAFADAKDLQDRVLRVSVQRGEAVLERKLAPSGTQGGLSAVIAEGKRAMTVRVNDVVGVAGFALPGNYVDVLVNSQRETGKSQPAKPISITVLEHVLVLAVAQEAGRDETKPKVVSAVTLELTPQDAEKLDLARSVGALSLVLRNQLDRREVATRGITKTQLLGEQEAAVEQIVAHAAPVHVVPAPRLAPATCIEVIQHATRATDCF
jgi:pilus assembly protein CpaB